MFHLRPGQMEIQVNMSQINKQKIILDTDIGDDIDDAFALILASESEKLDLIGVTTVFRNAYKRAKMASYLLSKLDKNIPVYAGIDMPLVHKIEDIIPDDIKKRETVDEDGKYHLPQYDDAMNSGVVEDASAVDFIIDCVHKYPHEIILVPIGPFTNIASAIKKDPSIVNLIKEVRVMGGGLDQNFSEWNIYCDPEAASILFSSGVKLSCVGLNVTMQTALDDAFIKELSTSKSRSITLVHSMMMKWFDHYKFSQPVMHDPLTVASLIDPQILTFEDLHLFVSLKKESYGFVFVDMKTPNLISYATKVDKSRFYKIFKELVFKNEIH